MLAEGEATRAQILERIEQSWDRKWATAARNWSSSGSTSINRRSLIDFMWTARSGAPRNQTPIVHSAPQQEYDERSSYLSLSWHSPRTGPLLYIGRSRLLRDKPLRKWIVKGAPKNFARAHLVISQQAGIERLRQRCLIHLFLMSY